MKQGYANRQVKDICTKGSSQIAQKDLEGLTGDYPIYGASGLIKNVDFYHQEKEYIGLVKDGSGIGRVMFLPPKSSVIGTLQYILPKEGYNIRYIGYCLQSLKLDKYKQGAAIPHIYFKDYGEAQILIADNPDEQQRIVALLDAEFAKIDALKANAEKNLQNAKNLFQAALKKELEPKEGWEAKHIKEIADIKGGKRVPKGYKLMTEPTSHPYIRVADFNDNGSVSLDDIHYIEDWVYKEIKRYTISANDVYISIAGTIGKSGIIPKELEGANLTENACKLVLNQGLYNRYVYYCTINESFKAQIAKLTMQAAQPKLALTRLASATISIPSLKDQQSIVARLDTLKEKCKTLQANYEKTLSLCDDLKQALLRKAFNGEL